MITYAAKQFPEADLGLYSNIFAPQTNTMRAVSDTVSALARSAKSGHSLTVISPWRCSGGCRLRRGAACLTVRGPTAPRDVTFVDQGQIAAFLNKVRFRIGIGDGSNALAQPAA